MKASIPTVRKAACKVTIQFDENIGLLEVEVPGGVLKSAFAMATDQIESILQFHKDITIVFCTSSSNSATMEFMLQVIKMIERYEWLEANKVKIHWRQRTNNIEDNARVKLANYLDGILQDANSSYGTYALA